MDARNIVTRYVGYLYRLVAVLLHFKPWIKEEDGRSAYMEAEIAPTDLPES